MTEHPGQALPNAFEYVDLPDGVTHYRCDGPEGAPTVLMLHGATVPVADINGLATGLRKYKDGQTVDITVKRGKEKKTFKVTLGKGKAGG